ncbi:SIMPL domain-containing protein [Aequorivita sinensis]|uniref:SIMPL domain-containing protein n=1 Tax=Aequorivita sinensis TaxID=1382458 RepID=UPI00111F2D42|nr:SIMPL domain-containing protein [Aequorivita sinensis]
MKKIIIVILATFLSQVTFGQVSGNINYQSQVRFPDQNINISTPSTTDIFISIKGLANIKADSYVAIFSVTQVGKTTEEVNELIDKRLSQAESQIKLKKGTETYIDMISFVPVYEYEVEKKLFSKKSYNEIPKGFELKKNIHIKYSDPNQLNDFISILSNQEIYDLVRVDYFSSTIENIKKELTNKAKIALQEKVKNYEAILGVSFATNEKRIIDGFKMMLPVEMYKSYESYNSSSLNLKKSANVNNAEKTTTLYYQPIIDKEFDFVINPTILEPVIQVMYEIKLVVNREKKPTVNEKEYILITPSGEMKNINLNK